MTTGKQIGTAGISFDVDAVITFTDKVFVLTGDFAAGEKSAITAQIEERGGKVVNGVDTKVNYVVVGNDGSQAWLHGVAGGEKVEKALEMKGKGKSIGLVSEGQLLGVLAGDEVKSKEQNKEREQRKRKDYSHHVCKLEDYEYERIDEGIRITKYRGQTDENISIPATIDGIEVISIGDLAFSGCSSLSNIEIPMGVTSIGYRAFWSCSSLSSIEIPASMINIGQLAFSECDQLKNIQVINSSNYPKLQLVDGVLYNEQVMYTFNKEITSFQIPAGVTSIGEGVFYGCSSLSSIGIPMGVTSIGDWAFSDCESLSSIEIPAGVTSIGEWAFWDCVSLSSIEIPSGVTSIGLNAFQGCSSLSKIEIPMGVINIGAGAFQGCSSLSKIEIPASVTSIGKEAFFECVQLKDIQVINSPNHPELQLVDGVLYNEKVLCTFNKGIESFQIPASVTSIGHSAFECCESLSSIEIPASVTSIGDWAFWDCKSLSSIEIPASVTSIGDWAFWDCESLSSIEIPASVTRIGDWAFSDCVSLSGIKIPAGVTSIGQSTFYECSSLIHIEIPASVTSIKEYAFYGCSSLINIEIPSNVTNIGELAFSRCSSLSSIEIPASVTSIGKGTFRGCSSLSRIEVPSNVTCIGDLAFFECSNLSSIKIPASVTSIGAWAFKGCTNLNRILILNTIPSMRSEALDAVAELVHETNDVFIIGWFDSKLYDSNTYGLANLSIFTWYETLVMNYKDFKSKVRGVTLPLMAREGLPEDMKSTFESYLKKVAKKAISMLIEDKELDIIRGIEYLGLITIKNIQHFINLAQKQSDTEMVAYLLNYQNEKLGNKAKKFKL